MPLPAQRTVTGLYTNPITGAPATGTVTFAPYPEIWTDTNGNQIMSGHQAVTLVNGAFSQPLVPTDTPAVFPTAGKLWRITEQLTGQPKNVWFFELETATLVPIDITDLVELDPEPPPFVPEGTAGGDLVGSYPSPQLRNTQTARDHLGLGEVATTSFGTASGTTAEGDDARIVGALQRAGGTVTGPVALEDGADVSIPNMTELLGALVPTGIIRGGAVDPHPTNPVAVIVNPFVGYISDSTADENAPSVVRVEKTTPTTIVNSNPANPITWYFLNKDGTFGQQSTEPTAADRVARLQLGFSLQASSVIIEAQTTHERITQRTGDWARFMESLGSFSVRGEEMFVSANGANLKINTSSGRVFNRAIGLYDGPTLNYERNVTTQAAVTANTFRIGTRDPATLSGPVVSDIIPGNYDVGGVVTPVPNPTGSTTIQRVYYSPLADANNRFFVQYGQSVYSSITDAVNAIGTTNYVVNPLLRFTLLIGYIVVVKTATVLNNSAQAVILPAERFRIR